MLFTPKKTYAVNPSRLESVSNVMDLELFLDPALSFTNHVSHKTSKSLKIIGLLRDVLMNFVLWIMLSSFTFCRLGLTWSLVQASGIRIIYVK